jgi:hypothetical protein
MDGRPGVRKWFPRILCGGGSGAAREPARKKTAARGKPGGG